MNADNQKDEKRSTVRVSHAEAPRMVCVAMLQFWGQSYRNGGKIQRVDWTDETGANGTGLLHSDIHARLHGRPAEHVGVSTTEPSFSVAASQTRNRLLTELKPLRSIASFRQKL